MRISHQSSASVPKAFSAFAAGLPTACHRPAAVRAYRSAPIIGCGSERTDGREERSPFRFMFEFRLNFVC